MPEIIYSLRMDRAWDNGESVSFVYRGDLVTEMCARQMFPTEEHFEWAKKLGILVPASIRHADPTTEHSG